MVFILEEDLEAKDGQQQVMEGDVIELGETAKILDKSMRPVDHVSSVTIIEKEAAREISKAAACVMFEKPTPKVANHIKPLYILGCLDGIPINRLLIDGGSAANLMPRTTMTKLGKTEQDLIASSASLLDFKGGLTSCEGIVIMKLTVGLDKYGRHKIVQLTSKSSTEDLRKFTAMLARFNAYLVDGRMMELHEEEERPNSANAAEFIYEDEGLEEVGEADEGTFKCYSEELAPYYMAAMQLLDDFQNAAVKHVPRRMNEEANSLAQASTGLKLSPGVLYKAITVQKRLLPSVKRRGLGLEALMADPKNPAHDSPDDEEIGLKDWREPIILFLKNPHAKATRKIRRKAISYLLIGEELYKKSPKDDLLLKCLTH
ncbi:hypothetical protein Vadar_007117 [Vaccinium darrowii]|uniref:Uncharacterized protein n=1 Tax=Vaccinium darrowii TaxID=229202 RepID=A0ACB7YKD2_9ERIC|nr:hypothetical protein Vadar_007117 [Vaccinium darrowii]